MIYGPPGCGKTLFGGTMPGPRVVLATEANSSIGLDWDFEQAPRPYVPEGEIDRRAHTYLDARTWDDVLEALELLRRDQKAWESLIVDTLSSLVGFVVADVLADRQASLSKHARAYRKGRPVIEALDQNGWGIVKGRLVDLMRQAHDLDLHVLWLVHVRQPRFDNDGTLEMPGGPDIAGGSKEVFPAHVQLVGYLDAQKRPEGICREVWTERGQHVTKANALGLARREPADATLLLAKLGRIKDADKILAAAEAAD